MPADSHDDYPACDKALTTRGHVARGLALAALLALVLGLLSACGDGDGGSDDPAASLSSAATEIADDLGEAAIDVGDTSLDDIADEVNDAARQLARVAEPDYDDLEDLSDLGDATWEMNEAIERYMERAATVAEDVLSEKRAEAALNAVGSAASFIEGSSWNPLWTELARRWVVLDFEEGAIDYEERHRERYMDASDEFADADTARAVANARYQVARAEAAVASFSDDAARRSARDALKDASDNRDDAQLDLNRAEEDWNYFYDLIVWRDDS